MPENTPTPQLSCGTGTTAQEVNDARDVLASCANAAAASKRARALFSLGLLLVLGSVITATLFSGSFTGTVRVVGLIVSGATCLLGIACFAYSASSGEKSLYFYMALAKPRIDAAEATIKAIEKPEAAE